MENIRISSRKLTDGSTVYAVRFEAVHADAHKHTVTIECNDEEGANAVVEALVEHVAYVETDPVDGPVLGAEVSALLRRQAGSE
jgi:glutamate-1-semialdehyde aminotransferase